MKINYKLGSYNADTFGVVLSTIARRPDGEWYCARPLPYRNFLVRLHQAWDVFRYKADALYWLIDEDK